MALTIAATVALMSGAAAGVGDSAVQAMETAISEKTANMRMGMNQRSNGEPPHQPR